MKQILCIFIFVFNIYLSLAVQAQNLPSKSLPKNLTVTFNYCQQINGFFGYNEKLPKTCKIKSTINGRLLICPAWVKILINKKQLLNWQQQQNKNGFINLYLPKIGVMHEKAKIAKIKKVIQKSPTSKNQHLVTAVYMRYARVLTYKIKDIDTGKIEEITTTPEHKFYETTYKKFIEISKLRSSNTITNALNHHLKINCTNNKQNNCGTASLNSLQKVYNIEVEKEHTYYIDNMKILVHNGCYDYYYRCRQCEETHQNRFVFSEECFKAVDKKHKVRKTYQCEFCGMNHTSLSRVEKHKIIHKEDPFNCKAKCSICNAILNNSCSIGPHRRIHLKNNNNIFCGECDTLIPLKDKLNKNHRHSLLKQYQSSSQQRFFRERSRSPIPDFSEIKDILYIDKIFESSSIP